MTGGKYSSMTGSNTDSQNDLFIMCHVSPMSSTLASYIPVAVYKSTVTLVSAQF